MNEFINKLIERLEELKELHAELIKDGLEEDYHSGCEGMCVDIIEIVNQLAEEYKPCHKPCTDCEEYDLVRNHCPKLCKLIKETVKEMEENHRGWIPVSSGKLPDDGVPVEVTVKEDNDNGGYDLYVFESWYQDGSWVISKNRYNPTVIAWKPKEAPYQPKGE